jgi:hypothetical protein
LIEPHAGDVTTAEIEISFLLEAAASAATQRAL